jgi:hypothetical protein
MPSNANSPNPRVKPGQQVATGCLVAFMLPFFAGGLLAVSLGIRTLLRGGGATVESMVPIAIGLVFLGVSTLILSAAMFGMRTAKANAELRDRNPDKPWLWRKEWAEGVIVSHDSAKSMTLAIFALFWNAFAIPSAWIVIERNVYRETPIVLVVLLFPLVGVFLFITAAYQLLRVLKYRQSRLMLPHVPIALGTSCRGEIITHVKDRPESGFALKLTCMRRTVTGSGKNRSIRETDIWREEQVVSPSAVVPAMDGVRVPFTFNIPSDAPPTDERITDNQVVWRLDVRAETSGIDYAAQFELPVFHTSETPHEVQRFTPTTSDAVAWMPSPQARIAISPLPTGGDEIRVGTHAPVLEMFPMLLFIAIWGGAIWLMIANGAPIIFPIIFGGIGVLILFAIFDSIVGRTIIRADKTGVAVRRSWFGVGFTRRIAANEIDSIVADPTSNSRYYQIDVIKGASKDAVAAFIADRKDAELLAARLTRATSAQ